MPSPPRPAADAVAYHSARSYHDSQARFRRNRCSLARRVAAPGAAARPAAGNAARRCCSQRLDHRHSVGYRCIPAFPPDVPARLAGGHKLQDHCGAGTCPRLSPTRSSPEFTVCFGMRCTCKITSCLLQALRACFELAFRRGTRASKSYRNLHRLAFRSLSVSPGWGNVVQLGAICAKRHVSLPDSQGGSCLALQESISGRTTVDVSRTVLGMLPAPDAAVFGSPKRCLAAGSVDGDGGSDGIPAIHGSGAVPSFEPVQVRAKGQQWLTC